MSKRVDKEKSEMLKKDFESTVRPVLFKLKETSQVDFIPNGFRFKYKGYDAEITFKVFE